MGGIAGWADFKKNMMIEFTSVHNMTEALSHRGPDASGYWKSENVILGHRRLAVVDVENGSQPMSRTRENRTCAIVYNGEIFNYKELRERLEAKGSVFETNCDTEVLLEGYMTWGEGCLEYLKGMFAFAIWEEYRDGDGNLKEEKLFLARDAIGAKPLFFAMREGGIIFSSEIPSLLQNRMVEAKVNKEGLAEIFVMAPARTIGNGIIEDVSEVKPGHFLIYDKHGMRERCYWELESHEHIDNLEVTIEKVRNFLTNSVKSQIDVEVPMACLLSGGLDSSAVSAITNKYFKDNDLGQLSTYSIDFFGNDKYFKSGSFQPDPDAPYAAIMAKELGTNHRIITIDNDDMLNALKEGVRYRGLPGMADIDVSMMLAFREIKENHTVILSGEGADEVYGGYPWFHKPEMLECGTFPWMMRMGEKTRVLKKDVSDFLKPKQYIAMRYEESRANVPWLDGENETDRNRRAIAYLNIYWFMQNLLERKDRMSMAAGIEARMPFGDHAMLQYVWDIPWEMKALNGREKGLLRKALEDILPEEIIYRKKSPYPKTHNPDYERKVIELLKETIADTSSPIREFVDLDEINRMMNESSDYAIPWYGQLMARPQLYAWLIQVDEWFRFLNVKF